MEGGGGAGEENDGKTRRVGRRFREGEKGKGVSWSACGVMWQVCSQMWAPVTAMCTKMNDLGDDQLTDSDE